MNVIKNITLTSPPTVGSARVLYSGREIKIVQQVSPNTEESANTPASSRPPESAASQGLLAQTSRLMELVQEMLERIHGIEDTRNQSLAEMQQLTVKLSLAISRCIIGTEPTLAIERIENLAGDAIRKLAGTPLTIWMNPDDLAGMPTADTGRLAGSDASLKGDPQLKPGDFRVESSAYGLESRVEDQLETIQRDLMEQLQNATTERRRVAGDNTKLGRFPNRRTGS